MDDALTATKPGKNKQIPTSRNVHDVSLSDDSLAGVFGLAASYPLLFEDLMSKLMGLLIVGVLRPSAFRPLPPRTSHEQARGRPRRRGGGI